MRTITKKSIMDFPYTNYVHIPEQAIHNHTFWEIFIILNGNCTHTVNGKTSKLPAGTVMILRPFKDSHFFRKFNDDSYRHRDFYIDDDDMRKWCDYVSPSIYDELKNPDDPVYLTVSPTSINFFEEMIFAPNYSAQKSDVQKNVHFSIIITLLTKILVARLPKRTSSWINELVQKLKNPDNFSYTVEELIADTPYSHCYICREFNKYTGKTIINFFTIQKMNHASYLLMNTNMKIIDIANTVGYESPKNFINQFTKIFSMPPSQWRNLNQLSIKK